MVKVVSNKDGVYYNVGFVKDIPVELDFHLAEKLDKKYEHIKIVYGSSKVKAEVEVKKEVKKEKSKADLVQELIETKTVKELKDIAKRLGIKGTYKMREQELAENIANLS